MKCIICERRPVKVDGLCGHCSGKLNSERNRKAKDKPLHFLTYKGHVVGLFPNGGRKLTPRLLYRSADKLPKRNTLDLNRYCDGFNREKIKAFKACVLQLAFA